MIILSVIPISDCCGRCIGDGGIGDVHVNNVHSVMKVSVIAIFVMAISDCSGRCIGDGGIGDDHDSGDDISDEFGDSIGDEYISDSYVSDDYQ